MPIGIASDSGGLYSRAESARYLKTSQRRLDELIRSGALCAVRDGRSVKVTGRELERYIADLPSYEPGSYAPVGVTA
jgi:excisionase family DNA binding protein